MQKNNLHDFLDFRKEILQFEKKISLSILSDNHKNETYILKILDFNNSFLNNISDEFFLTTYRFVSKNSSKKFNSWKKIISSLTHSSHDVFSIFLTKHLFESLIGSPNNSLCLIHRKDELMIPEYEIIAESSKKSLKLLNFINYCTLNNNNCLDINTNKNLRHLFLSTTDFMINSQILKEKIVRRDEKTIRFLNMPFDFRNSINFHFFKTSSKLYIINGKGFTSNIFYWSFDELQKKNKHSNIISNFNPNLLNFINNLLNVKLFIDYDILSPYFKTINDTYTISNLTLNNSISFKSILEDYKYSHGLKTKLNYYENYIKDEIKNYMLFSKDYETRKSTEKKINEFINHSNICSLIENKDLYSSGFYIQFFMDFRGRIYFTGNLNPTNNKIFRSVLNYGSYTSHELEKIELNISKTTSWGIIEKQIPLLTLLFNTNILTFKKYEISGLFWSLIEASKIHKSKLLNSDHISLETFIKEGHKIFLQDNNELNDEDALTLIKLRKVITNILNHSHHEKTIYFKDSTASVLQHLTKLLGFKNSDSLKYCNFIDSNNWWDPYTYIINSFINQIENKNLKKLFNRKTLKKMIMTHNYSATLWRNIDDSMNKIRETSDYKDLLLSITELDKKIIIELIKFYNHLKTKYELEHFFEYKSENLFNNLDNKNNITMSTEDDSNFELNYYKLKEKRTNINSKTKRKTSTFYEASDIIDLKSTKRSFRANLIHISDSQYLRLLLSEYQIIAIHDSFGIDIFNICNFIDSANIHIKKQLIKTKFNNIDIKKTFPDSYSIFLLL